MRQLQDWLLILHAPLMLFSLLTVLMNVNRYELGLALTALSHGQNDGKRRSIDSILVLTRLMKQF